jgi:hypothetical protein
MNLVILISSVQMFFRKFRPSASKRGFWRLCCRARWSQGRSDNHRTIRKTCGMVGIAAPPAGSRNVNGGAISEAEGPRGGGQLSADNGLLCGPLVRQQATGSVFDGSGGKKFLRSVQKTAVAIKAIRRFRLPLARHGRSKRRGKDDSNSAKNGPRSADWRGAPATRAALNCTNHGEPRPHTDQNQMAGGRRIGSPSR